MGVLNSVAIGLAALASATAALAVAAAPELQAANGLHQGGPGSTCVVTHNKVGSPSTVLLGETVDVTLTASLACPGVHALHIVLVLDASGSMAGERNKEMKTAATRLVERLDLAANPGINVGVAWFNSTARTMCELTNQEGRVIGCIRSVPTAGGTRVDLGIMEGLKILRRGRGRVSDREMLREVMIVLADGPNNTGCPPVLQAAGQVKSQGILLIMVCLGADCDASCLRRAATDPSRFFEAQQPTDLTAVFERIYREIVGVSAKSLDIADVLPDNIGFVSASTDATWDEGLRQLTWTTRNVGPAGVTHTYKVEPLEAGRWPLNVEAAGVFLDNGNASGRFTFTVPMVTVLEPGGVPTPFGTPPPPPASPSPAVTRTPTPRAGSAYLPLVRTRHD